ncbi:MAG: hypothetical protein WCL23_00005, partial [Candidatus Moraniibacteriota bacterium]
MLKPEPDAEERYTAPVPVYEPPASMETEATPAPEFVIESALLEALFMSIVFVVSANLMPVVTPAPILIPVEIVPAVSKMLIAFVIVPAPVCSILSPSVKVPVAIELSMYSPAVPEVLVFSTESFPVGLVVPMPTLPALSIIILALV